MSNVEQKRRELFEARERGRDRLISAKYCGQYISDKQQERWLDWNAALDAFEIELPDRNTEVDEYDGWQTWDDCRDAIDKTGLGLKVK